MSIDYGKKYRRKDNPEWTADKLVLNEDGKLWFITENDDCVWCYEREFVAGYELVSEDEK